jgi:DNA replication protein DnaC
MAYTEFLALLIQDEVARCEQKKLHSRLRRANFRSQKTLEQFDFEVNRAINRALIQELATGRYIQERVAVLFCFRWNRNFPCFDTVGKK